MSHFTTFVITKTNDRKELDRLMLPYHEYECTGITDYCIHVDRSEDAIKEYNDHKEDYTPEEFVDSWYGVNENEIYEEEPSEKPEDSYAIIKDGEIKKVYDFTNPNHKWDYYIPYDWKAWSYIDGLKDGDEPETIKKSQFNIDQFMADKRDYFSGLYNKLKPYFTEDFISWEQARKENPDNIDKAREIYNNQESIKKMDKGIGSTEMFHIRWSITVDDIASMTEEEFVQNNLSTAAPFWAMVLPTGEWIEKGHMGWWAVSWDEDENFNKTWTEVWKTIPDDYYIWRCDCHT